MARYATLAQLLARASADDLARAASRDEAAPVDGALLRRAARELQARGLQALDGKALGDLRSESSETVHAGASTTRDFDGGDFTISSGTAAVAAPRYAAPSYVAVAVPAAASPIVSIEIGGFDQFGAFVAGAAPVTIGGEPYRYWRTTRPWSTRSGGTTMRIAPFGGGEALWPADAVAALPATLRRIEAALTDADAEIDSRIRSRYESPAPSPALTLRACDIAAQEIIGAGEDSTEHRRWSTAIHWLRDVSRGAIELDRPAAAPPAGRIVDVRGPLAGLSAL